MRTKTPADHEKGTVGTLRTPRLLEAKEAVAIANSYCQDLFPLAAKGNLMLEELDRSEDGRKWLVTMGFDTGRPRTLLDMRFLSRLQDLLD